MYKRFTILALMTFTLTQTSALAARFDGDSDDEDQFSYKNTIDRLRREDKRYREEEERLDEERMRREAEMDAKARSADRTDAPGDKPDISDDDNITERIKRPDIDTSSQFNMSDFQDADFGRKSFRDLDLEMRKSKDDDRLFAMDRDSDDRRKDDDDDDDDDDKDKKRKKAELYKRLTRVDLGMPGDWAPSALDPIDNGGFTISDDNGSPVPYKLNGHIDIQRKPAWQAAD